MGLIKGLSSIATVDEEYVFGVTM
ncbi:hypothetical protein CCACVL1_08229 [Corchorus capsularis]|uniref:Uncharacterized protein n=1 Tax=Corchorus capsularis TaxID=210143 RepID=A0A1R3J1N7_COCAP|nr:hypothetical protein CCACVL1_08229 [Corchorus capsularis]